MCTLTCVHMLNDCHALELLRVVCQQCGVTRAYGFRLKDPWIVTQLKYIAFGIDMPVACRRPYCMCMCIKYIRDARRQRWRCWWWWWRRKHSARWTRLTYNVSLSSLTCLLLLLRNIYDRYVYVMLMLMFYTHANLSRVLLYYCPSSVDDQWTDIKPTRR